MRLIDADELKIDYGFTWDDITPTHDEMYALIDRQPTIEERKNGKWLEQDDGWDGIYYECSCCKDAFTLIDGNPSENLYNYCPNCGARMVQEGEDNGQAD